MARTPRPESPAAGRRDAGPLTVPNALSVLRLAGVPLFLWLLLGPRWDGWAVVVLMVAGFTDWLDGKAARWLDQYSRLGELLDPVADRLYILATLLAFLVRGIVPWWVVAALVLRDVVLAACLPVLRARGWGPPTVTYIGKAATFNLLYAFPLLLLAQGGSFLTGGAARFAEALGWAFTGWGGALYLWSGVIYLVQVVQALRIPAPVRLPTPVPEVGEGADRLSG